MAKHAVSFDDDIDMFVISIAAQRLHHAQYVSRKPYKCATYSSIELLFQWYQWYVFSEKDRDIGEVRFTYCITIKLYSTQLVV